MLFIIEIIVSLVALAIAFVNLLFRQFTEKYDYWSKKNIVTAPVYPFFGSYKDVFLLKCNISQFTCDLYKKYSNEKFIGTFKWNKPEVIVRDPDLIKHILIKDFEYFQDRGFTNNEENEPISQHLFLSNGQKWKELRNDISSTFSPNVLENLFALLVECGDEFQNYIKTVIDGGFDIEIRELMTFYTMSVVGSCAFGINPKINNEEREKFKKIGKVFSKPSFLNPIKALIQECVPKLFNLFNLRMVGKESEEFFLRRVATLMESRRFAPSERRDYIDALLELKSKFSTEIMKQTNAAQAFAFLDLGFDTTSSTLGFALHELAVNRDIQKLLLKEMDAVLLKYDDTLTYQAVCEMQYLDMVIDETLRMYPPNGILRRICKKRYEIPSSAVVLDEGVSVLIPVFGLHYDAKYFFEPEVFNPERFSPEKKRLIPSCVYLPFGEGPRSCLGYQFAKLQIKVGLISLLHKYSIETSVKTKYDIEYDPASTVTATSTGIWLRLRIRNN